MLLSSIKLTDESDPAVLVDASQPLVGDFSSFDLIRNRIADPAIFEPPPEGPQSDEIVVVSHDVLRTESGNVNSRWSFSMNPLSYFQKSEAPAGSEKTSDDAPEIELESEDQKIGQDDRPISSPQPELGTVHNFCTCVNV